MQVRPATHAPPRLRPRSPALLPAEFRQRHLASRHQRIRRLRPGHHPRHQPPRRESRRPLGPPDFHHRRTRLQPAVPALRAKFPSSPTTSPRAPDSPTPSATSVPSSSAPDTASSSSAFPRSTTRSSRPKTASPTPASFSTTTNYYDHQVFPTYPNPLVSCPLYAANCALPCGIHPGRHQ